MNRVIEKCSRLEGFLEQEAAQDKNINQFLSGVAIMKAAQTGLASSFSSIGQAMIKNQKMTANQMAGMAIEAIGTQVMQKGAADLVMGIFPPNPAQLGAGAAEMAVGIGIGRIGHNMQGNGGQADSGMDYIPDTLSGKSFILSGGERVVQPTANRDLTNYLESQKNGSSGGGNTYITLEYYGNGSADDAKKMVDIVLKEIRARSDRGSPIMSPKGLTKT